MFPDGTFVEEPYVNDAINIPVFLPGEMGALQAYQAILPQLSQSGPTHYNRIISEINSKVVTHDLYYKVLVIITDGDPNDMDLTIDRLVVSSHKPISLLIISVQQEIQDKAYYNQIENHFTGIKKLASEIQYSK